ncbi:YceH family protein [Desulfopila aestuarii]|uniref:Uncharacterized protein n=1 Tax=Desulfopila aestuarii DSM 18488 TaxID=1121416 RepID=A0A1M7YB10_9BACT|nr:YceH family protein [Desulfopila aestuarii]SHO49807.1 hypothetical protein SAMN02745220_03103 [Desulfopila aestuarii DSM 18488]
MDHLDTLLNNPEVRVLGCLLEKEMATPEYYPLTLNALINACNQKTNREPVVVYDETTVMSAVEGLRSRKMVRQSSIGRALKFEQIFSDSRNFIAKEKAIICILLLRGPQTIGEIRGRTDRLYSFSDLDEVRATLENLEETGIVKRLPMQPGRKEARYGHLLGGESLENSEQSASGIGGDELPGAQSTSRIEELQEQINSLQEELDQLRQEFATFRSQFE